MSHLHRHNPELADTLDRIFGVHVTSLADAQSNRPDHEHDIDWDPASEDFGTCTICGAEPPDHEARP